MAITTIFWDIGRVILSNGWGTRQRARTLTAIGAEIAPFEERYEAANYYWERGLADTKWFFDQTLFYEPRSYTLEQVWQGILEEQTLMYPGSVEILTKLRAGKKYRLATLNNESRELNEYRLDHFNLRQYFDFFICSGNVGEMKPHPAIYRTALEIAGSKPEDCIFIDDKLINCEAAENAGMRAIHFKGSEELEVQLKEAGIEF